MQEQQGRHWWESRAFALALILATAIPLLWPDIPPLVDLPGHMARYRVQIEIDQSAALRSFYDFRWALIGNLGVDLLVVPLAKIFGLELAVKLIVLSIPPLTAAGFIWVAREVHGNTPPTAAFAVPLAYNYPFFFGFVNFALSMAFAFLAFALWLRLARLDRLHLRMALFPLISILVWVTHTFGWGVLGVMAFSAELVRQVDLKRTFVQAGLRAALHSMAIAPPILLMVAWRGGDHIAGRTTDWFNWDRKLDWLIMALRDRWEMFDLGSLGLLLIVLLLALIYRRMEYSRNLAASAIFLAVVFALLPRIVFGSAYADMRLVPYLLAVAVIGIRLRPNASLGFATRLAFVALAFFVVRTGAATISQWRYDRNYDRELPALAHVPENARLISFVGRRCADLWAMSRMEHLPGIATVRRRAFSNDQWSMPGAQLLTVHYPAPRFYTVDPSQMVTLFKCRQERWMTIDNALRHLPREDFDYVWLVRPPPHDPKLLRGLRPLWRNRTSVLYEIVDRNPDLAP
ncbi:hypothetical protein [Sphingosinicella rhizophila]|uniref:Glycosyltransferase RgtA/B/C/D-like domain-containing protein n=1 Tax=Sphingosinicella rhizophila TaxID=3050082 RepID=A0ABU3Q806_9SPHN|nr:hypothetical protein [Sphingosinicella sp. GR2756]MDT9599457.1 hypothetical protein [Sphingosinicella sp. GR2756]